MPPESDDEEPKLRTPKLPASPADEIRALGGQPLAGSGFETDDSDISDVVPAPAAKP